MVAVQTGKNRAAVKLAESVRHSDEKHAPFLAQRKMAIRKCAGPYYCFDDSTRSRVRQPMNTIYSFKTIVLPSLTAHTLGVEGTSEIFHLQAHARKLALCCTKLLAEIRAADAYETIIEDALYGMGIAKVGLAGGLVGEAVDFEDWRRDPSRPYWERVSPDRWIQDPDCEDYRAADFIGDRFAMIQEEAYETFKRGDLLDRLEPRKLGRAPGAGTADLSAGSSAMGRDEYIPHFELMEIYLPRENAIVTLPTHPEDVSDFLDEREHDGPEPGPYGVLTFDRPQDNTIGISPIDQIMDAHDELNELARMVQRQAERAKDLWLVKPGAGQQADVVRGAHDGQMVFADPANFAQLHMGGADKDTITTMEFISDWQNRNGPNAEILGGVQRNAKTLGQDQLKLGQASHRLERMIRASQSFGTDMCRRFAWYVWNSPSIVRDLADTLDDGSTMPLRWDPLDREGDLLDLNITLDVFSIGPDSPERKYADTMEIVERAVIPLVEHAAAQGTYFDVGALVNELAKMKNIKANRWWKAAPPQVMGVTGNGGAGPMQQETTNISLGGNGNGNSPRGTRMGVTAAEQTRKPQENLA